MGPLNLVDHQFHQLESSLKPTGHVSCVKRIGYNEFILIKNILSTLYIFSLPLTRALMELVVEALRYVIHMYEVLILASVVMSWINMSPDHPVVQAVSMLTEPVYRWIRNTFSFIPFHPLDWSPMIFLFALALLERGLFILF